MRTVDLWCWKRPLYQLRHNQYPSAGKFSKSKAVVVAQLADLFRPVSLGSSFLYFNIVETTLCWSIAHWFATSNQSAEFHRKVVMLCLYLLMTSSPIQLRQKSFAVLIPDVAGVDLSVSESRMIHLEMGSTPCRHYLDMSVYFDCTKNYFKWAIFWLFTSRKPNTLVRSYKGRG